MNLKEIRKIIEDIISTVDSLDPEYRIVAFEMILSRYLQLGDFATPSIEHGVIPKDYERQIIHIDVRAFLAQFGIDESSFKKLFIFEENLVRPIYTLKTTSKIATLAKLACLLALENAISTGSFAFETDELRARLDALGAYEHKRFRQNLRRSSSLFKNLENPEWIELSAQGKAELAQIIWEITQ